METFAKWKSAKKTKIQNKEVQRKILILTWQFIQTMS